MKKIYMSALLMCFGIFSVAQNLQLHYDFGKDRHYFTSTVEMFKPDKWGSTFFFVDMDYNVGDVKGVSMAYWEIARAINLSKESPLAFHVEYNGGFGQFWVNESAAAYQIDDSWLGGLEYNYNNSDFTKGFTLQALYKYIRNKHNASFQITGVWYLNMLGKKLTFNGFADFWREDNRYVNGEEVTTTKFVFQSEPQLWYNFTENFSAGSEIEIGCNFGPVKGWRINPTLGAKWSF